MNKPISLMLIGLLAASIIALNLPRHLNPQQILPEKPFGRDLLTLYVVVINAVIDENFTKAWEGLQTLVKIHIPENIRYIYSRFNELLDKEVSKLNETFNCLDECEVQLSHGYLEKARSILRDASRSLAEAELIHQELEETSRELSRTMDIPLDRLSEHLKKLQELIRLYHDRLNELSIRIKELEERELTSTRLTISINPSEAVVGSTLIVSGLLYTEDYRLLSGKRITIYLDGKQTKSFSTSMKGVFNGSIRIPYVYKPEIEIYAEYMPTKEDLGRLKAARSNVVKVKLIYETPLINAWTNESRVKPLQSLMISGYISNTSRIFPNSIYIRFFEEHLAIPILAEGFFNATLTVPAKAASGIHKILLYVEPFGKLAPASRSLTIIVYREQVFLNIKAPYVVLSGGITNISGIVCFSEISSNGEVLTGSVIIETPWGTYQSKVIGESFSVNLTVPWTAFSGIVKVKLTYVPSSPIYEKSSSETVFLIVNPLTVLIPAFAISYLLRLGTKGLPKWRESIIMPMRKYEVSKEQKPVASLSEVVKTYLEAVKIVEEMIGVKRVPSDTIREFLDKVVYMLGREEAAFSELSYMTEAAVYGGVQPDMEIARYLLNSMIEVGL